MRILYSDKAEMLDPEETLWVYNALDCLGTEEILAATLPQLTDITRATYNFERELAAPAMEIMLRGILVDEERRQAAIKDLEAERIRIDELLATFGRAVIDQPLNPNSRKQVYTTLHTNLRLPEQKKYDRKKKEEVLALDREALEKLATEFIFVNPLINTMLARRDNGKKLSVLQSGVDPDGRMRFNFNIAGTETGRWSSSKNITAGGMNAQNITEKLRGIFVADPGKKFCYLDLEQAESKAVAFLSGDPGYTKACYSGDLHTTVARLVWPKHPWTGDLDGDRKLADQNFYRHFSYRDMSKRGGHLTNYLGNPITMAKHLKLTTDITKAFQTDYFRAFPGIQSWQARTIGELQKTGILITPFGRRRRFLGRLWDTATHREAVAHVPQSMIGDYLNKGLKALWYEMSEITLHAQVHDAILFQYPEDQDELCFKASEIVSREWNGFANPSDLAVGWNWSKASDDNPYGLKKLSRNKPDTRRAPKNETAEILDRRVS